MAYAVNMYMPFSLYNIKILYKLNGINYMKGKEMLDLIIYILIFITGTYFGSFFTLAVYRIPKKENIVYKHSYCPNCNHKLGILDLVPVFSYIFLRGRCRYCKEKIRPRYFLLEIFTGIIFVLYSFSIKLKLYNLQYYKIFECCLQILYICGIVIIAGIDKERKRIERPVLVYTSIIAIATLIYRYFIGIITIQLTIIYISLLIILYLVDLYILKRKMKNNYILDLVILILCMCISTKVNIIIITILLTILSIGIANIIGYIRKINYKNKPVAFYMIICNIVSIIIFNIFCNYIIK